MRLLEIAALVLLVLPQQNPTAQQAAIPKGTIEGLVLHIGTGDPIPGARVTLTRVQGPPTTALPALPGAAPPQAAPPAPPAPVAPQTNPAVNTDTQGKFVFK